MIFKSKIYNATAPCQVNFAGADFCRCCRPSAPAATFALSLSKRERPGPFGLRQDGPFEFPQGGLRQVQPERVSCKALVESLYQKAKYYLLLLCSLWLMLCLSSYDRCSGLEEAFLDMLEAVTLARGLAD